jgi:hypothetical protein
MASWKKPVSLLAWSGLFVAAHAMADSRYDDTNYQYDNPAPTLSDLPRRPADTPVHRRSSVEPSLSNLPQRPAVDQSRILKRPQYDRHPTGFSPAEAEGLWLEGGFIKQGEVDGLDNGVVMLGYDWALKPRRIRNSWRPDSRGPRTGSIVGLGVGYSYLDADSGDLSDWFIAVHGTSDRRGVYVGGALYWGEAYLDQSFLYGGEILQDNELDANVMGADLFAKYDFMVGGFRVTPGLLFSYGRINEMSDTIEYLGEALEVKLPKTEAVNVGADLAVSYSFRANRNITFTPWGSISYMYDFAEDNMVRSTIFHEYINHYIPWYREDDHYLVAFRTGFDLNTGGGMIFRPHLMVQEGGDYDSTGAGVQMKFIF